MSEYPAGTVAMVTAYNRNTPYRAYFDGKTWREHGADLFCVDVPTSIRPLVVLDLSDAPFGNGPGLSVVELLRSNGVGSTVEWIADQIEAQTGPPKPAEPTGLGAVVEDRWGHRYVRTNWPTAPWCNVTEEQSCTWDHVAAVRILSDGVTA